ncbi:MAG TPA: transcription termination/antitermination protein NusA [Dehalococcoidia bacterium]|nr:transcription termination/antitermination protein NusA [Dehalococcoidia bacterium]
MKSEFLLAITQLSAEKNLPKDVVLTAVEAALVSAYKKDNFGSNQNIAVKIDPNSGRVEVWAEKAVVRLAKDKNTEISLREAKKIKEDVEVGDTLMVESTPANAGRIAAQTAKQVILQRLHEAEHSAIFEEYADREGEVISGVVQRFELGQVNIDLGRTEAVLPPSEQVRTERYRVGQRLKVVLLQVARTSKGPRVIVSRSHPDLLRRLFELEVPEVYNGTVEIKGIAREAGYRSKIAVAAKQEGIDPVGCCVGLRGIRIQNIVSELNGEKIDVVMWSPDVTAYIANALSPAHIISVELNEEEQAATVVVPDKQLSLAIGKEGQNARLAAKLTGWRIDIKSASIVEAEKVTETRKEPEAGALEETKAEMAEAEPIETEPVKVESTVSEEEQVITEEIPEEITAELESLEIEEEAAEEEAEEEEEETEPVAEEMVMPTQMFAEALEDDGRPQLRFAEDILPGRRGRSSSKSDKSKKKRKGGYVRDTSEDGVRMRRGQKDYREDEDDEYY